MTRRSVSVRAGLLLILSAPTQLWAQSGARSCGQIPPGVLKPGQQLSVTLRMAGADRAATEIRGRLLAWSPDTITIERAPEHVVIGLREVARIQRRRSVGKQILTAVVVAGAATTLIDLGSSNPEPGSAFVVGGLVIGLPAGAILAARAPFGPPLCESP